MSISFVFTIFNYFVKQFGYFTNVILVLNFLFYEKIFTLYFFTQFLFISCLLMYISIFLSHLIIFISINCLILIYYSFT